MSSVTVKEILREIDSLAETDRLRLDRALTSRLAEQWEKQAAEARKLARRRRINQKVIDQAIERRRYGR